MSAVAAIGRPSEVGGFALAGAHVLPARTATEAVSAWHALPPGTGVVILTEEAGRALVEERARPGSPLVVVMPA